MATCGITPKVFLTLLTFIYWMAAAILIFIGSWVFINYHHYEELTKSVYTLIPASIMIAVGVFLFVVSILGCAGACKEQNCLLGTYCFILLVILVGLVVSASMGYVYRSDVDDAVTTAIKDAMDKYGNPNKTVTREIDFMQEQFKCCGLDNYTDWQSTPYGKAHPEQFYPDSCCDNSNCSKINGTDHLNKEGCYQKVKDEFQSHLAWIIGASAVFALIQIVGMISACVLLCRKNEDPPYIGLTRPDDMRV